MPNELARVRSSSRAIARSGFDVLGYFLKRRSPRTLAAYQADMGDFARFMREKFPESFPNERDPAASIEFLLNAGQGAANAIGIDYRDELEKKELKSATIARRISALRSMVKIANVVGQVSWELTVESPKVKPYRDTRGPGLEGWEALLAKAWSLANAPIRNKRDRPDRAKRDHALIRIMHDLGLRRGECVALDLADLVAFDSDYPKVSVIGKGETDPEPLTLPVETREALRLWLNVRGWEPGPLFVCIDPASEAAGITLRRLSGVAVWRMKLQLSKLAGLKEKARPHGLRHQAITDALDKTGGDVRRVQKFSRHKKVETILRYDDSRRDDAGDIARMIAAGRKPRMS